MLVRDAIGTLAGILASIAHLDPDREIDLTLNFGLKLHKPEPEVLYVENIAIGGIEDLDTMDEVHFLYRKPGEWDVRGDILAEMEDEIRVGSILNHDYSRRMTLVYDYKADHPKWYKWNGVCRCYVIRHV